MMHDVQGVVDFGGQCVEWDGVCLCAILIGRRPSFGSVSMSRKQVLRFLGVGLRLSTHGNSPQNLELVRVNLKVRSSSLVRIVYAVGSV